MSFGAQKNLKTDFGAVGDGQLVTAAVSITIGLKVLTCAANPWVSGDVGKPILLDGGGAGVGGTFFTTIASFQSAGQITLADAATSTLASSVQTFGWGTDDSAAFIAANTFARGQLPLGMDLLIPAGMYMMSAPGAWCRFVPQFRATWDGAHTPTLLNAQGLGSFFYPEQATTFPISSRVATAVAGATSVQLLTPSEYPRFQPGNTYTLSDGTVYTAGTTGIMRALDMQGFGDPNPFYSEFVTLTGVNPSTGAIALASRLKNTYLSTYPCYDAGGPFLVDQGGPATLYMLDASWICDQQFIGLNFWQPDRAINAWSENIRYTNCKWIPNPNGLGPNPSVHRNCTFEAGSDFTGCFVEVDKTIDSLNLTTGTKGHILQLQSSSIQNLNIDSSCVLDQLTGTARNSVVNGAVGILGLGPTGYGRADSFFSNAGNFAAIAPSSITDTGVNDPANGWTISNGVISRPTYLGPTRWGIPGNFVMFAGQAESETGFFVTSLTCDGDSKAATLSIASGSKNLHSTTPLWLPGDVNKPVAVGGAGVAGGSLRSTLATITDSQNAILADAASTALASTISGVTWGTTYIGTTISGPGWPNVALEGGTRLDVMVHPCPNATFINCTGCDDAVDLSNPAAWGKPAYDYSKRTYNAAKLASPAGPRLWGNIVSVNVTVGTPFTTSGALSIRLFGQFSVDGLTVDLKTSGLRTITPTTIIGKVGADSLTPPGVFWFGGPQTPFVSGAITGGDPGTVTIEVQTDQGFAPSPSRTLLCKLV